MKGQVMSHVWRPYHPQVVGLGEGGTTFIKDVLSIIAVTIVVFPLVWLWNFNQKRGRPYRESRTRFWNAVAAWRGARATLRDARRHGRSGS